jgi:hypothetical protein
MRRTDWGRTEPGGFLRSYRPRQPALRGWLARTKAPVSGQSGPGSVSFRPVGGPCEHCWSHQLECQENHWSPQKLFLMFDSMSRITGLYR